ncbi:MAG: hypothetical protein F9K38_13750 [Pseudorhodoplanes sp.]|nr:MAG: hypothetical protein F9K38_13750 [Pseudorhodoplanes sp.]
MRERRPLYHGLQRRRLVQGGRLPAIRRGRADPGLLSGGQFAVSAEMLRTRDPLIVSEHSLSFGAD